MTDADQRAANLTIVTLNKLGIVETATREQVKIVAALAMTIVSLANGNQNVGPDHDWIWDTLYQKGT